MPDLPTAGAPANKYTYDLEIAEGGPHRPDLAEMGGEDFRDKVGSPPQKGRDPYAGLFSEHSRNLTGLNRMTATVKLWLKWDSGESLWSIDSISAMGTKVEADSFLLNPNATGELDISWDSGVLPPMEHAPLVIPTGSFGRAYGVIDTSTNVVIYMRDENDSPADIDIYVEIG